MHELISYKASLTKAPLVERKDRHFITTIKGNVMRDVIKAKTASGVSAILANLPITTQRIWK